MMDLIAESVTIVDMCFGFGLVIYGIIETFTNAPAGWIKILIGATLISNMAVILNCRW